MTAYTALAERRAVKLYAKSFTDSMQDSVYNENDCHVLGTKGQLTVIGTDPAVHSTISLQ